MIRHCLSILSLATVLVSGGAAVAAGQNGEGAIVLNSKKFPLSCKTFGFGLPNLFATDNIHIVVTPSGNAHLVCHFVIPEGFAPQRAITAGGFPCTIGPVQTTKSSFTATPGGKATLACLAKGVSIQP